MRTRIVLCYMDEEFLKCFDKRCAHSGYIFEPTEVGRYVCKAEVLPELRSRRLYGGQ